MNEARLLIRSRRLRWVGHVVRMEDNRNTFKILIKKPMGKGTRRRWEDNLRMDIIEVGIERMNWIQLTEDRDQRRVFVNAVLKL